MTFEWDEEKNRINIEQHGIDFKDALEVFFDKDRIILTDDREKYFESREICIGKIGKSIIITSVFTDRNDKIRIISARKANKRERSIYYE